MLSFLQPLYLLLGLLISIPIIIHLYKQRFYKPKDFPALFLLKNIKAENLRRIRLKDLLLLIIRILIITCFTLFLARPTCNSRLFGPPIYDMSIILDTSFSMNASLSDTSYLDRLKPVLSSISKDSRISIHTISDTIETILPSAVYSSSQIRSSIATVKPGFGGTNLASIIQQEIGSIGERKGLNKAILLLSDLRSYDLTSFKLPDIAPPIYFVPLPSEIKRAYIDSIEWLVPPTTQGKQAKLKAIVYNPYQEVLTLSCYLNGVKKGEEGIPMGRQSVVFALSPSSTNASEKGLLQLSGNAKISRDRLYFTLNQSDTEKILVIGNLGENDPLIFALNPGEGSPFQTEIVSPSNLSMDQVEKCNAVIIVDTEGIKKDIYEHLFKKPCLFFATESPVNLSGITDGGLLKGDRLFTVLPSNNPILEDIRFQTVEVYKAKKIKPDASWSNILLLNDAPPLLLYRGSTFLLNTRYSGDWSNIANTSAFLPLLYQILYYGLQMGMNNQNVGERIVLRKDVSLIDEKGNIINFEAIKGNEHISPRIREAGWYSAGERILSVNIPHSELQSGFSKPNLTIKAFSQEGLSSVSKIEIAWYILLLAGFLILLDIGIALFWR